MSFAPVLIGSGLVGWSFLNSTMDAQRSTFDKSADIARDTDYFKAKIGQVEIAADLVADRRLLRVALGAFGLQSDIDNRFFVRKILEEGTGSRDALANKLADDRYKSLASAFGFDAAETPNWKAPGFADGIITRFREQQFEVAVGEQDNSLRLALNLKRSLPDIASDSGSANAGWFRVMGTPPLRTVFETALGLPSGFGQLDIDRQLEVFKDKAQARFGTSDIAELTQPEQLEDIARTYLLQAQVADFSASGSGQVALTLLQNIPRIRA